MQTNQPDIDELWEEMIVELALPGIVSSWSFSKGYLGTSFCAQWYGSSIRCTASAINHVDITKKDVSRLLPIFLAMVDSEQAVSSGVSANEGLLTFGDFQKEEDEEAVKIACIVSLLHQFL